jgi:murein DD-endopeptidase MepM/ murein hydrolase activator NlpD
MQKYFVFVKKFINLFKRGGDDDRPLMEKLRDKYRLVILNDETFEEMTSLRLSPLNVYTFLSSLIVGTAFIVVLLIVYTPLKQYIPGYGDFQRNSEIAALTSKVRDLEQEMEAHRRYNENMRKILLGDLSDMGKESVARPDTAESGGKNAAQSGSEPVARIAEDERLRAAVERGTLTNPGAERAALKSAGSGEIPLEQLFFMPPVSGDLTAGFDPSKEHYGVDVAAPRNTAVKAAADGVVISSGYTVETGYNIAIQHPNNVVTMYKHNSVLLKKAGSAVKAGEAVAIIGNSGETTSGPHLHFELWYKGRAVNPNDYINFN